MLLIRKLPISHYLLCSILKYAEINMNIPKYLIEVFRPEYYKYEYKYEYRYNITRKTHLYHQSLVNKLTNPKIKIYRAIIFNLRSFLHHINIINMM